MKQHLKDIALGAALAVLLLGTAKAASDIWTRAYNNYATPTNNVAIAQSMAVPPLVSATASSSSGTLVTSSSVAGVPTWYFEVEAVDPNGGATLPSNEISATLATSTGATSSVALVWGAVQGAVSYNIFTGSSPSTTQPIFIVKYAQAYAKAPACIIDAQNSAASALAVGARPYMLPTTTSTAAMSNTTALGATTVYQWNWICSN